MILKSTSHHVSVIILIFDLILFLAEDRETVHGQYYAVFLHYNLVALKVLILNKFEPNLLITVVFIIF